MSDRAIEFLDYWEAEHVEFAVPSERTNLARRLAVQCREDALRFGISETDLLVAAGGDLVSCIHQALNKIDNEVAN